MWEATSQGNNDAIDRLLDSSTTALTARAADGRGLLFWAYEFQNTHVLAAILAHGGDVEAKTQDAGGKTAVQMCEESSECKKDELIQKAKDLVEDLKKGIEERKNEREALDA